MEILTVRLTRDGRWWAAEVKEIPGCLSQGRTPASALVNLADALRLLESTQSPTATLPKTVPPARGS